MFCFQEVNWWFMQMEINPQWSALCRDDVIPEPFVLKEGVHNMSPLCPFHLILMNSKTFHTLLTQSALKSCVMHAAHCANLLLSDILRHGGNLDQSADNRRVCEQFIKCDEI